MNASLTAGQFNNLRRFIYDRCGIKLSHAKQTMLESRLQKRLTALGMGTFSEYCDFLFSDLGVRQELTDMINVVTTNKTDFFREDAHFQFMADVAIPALRTQGKDSRAVKVWSSACSAGQEVYTIAMVMEELSGVMPLNYSILGSDISTNVLAKAAAATYPAHEANPIPMALRKKYLLKSKDSSDPRIRIVPTLRGKVSFKRINLIDDHLDVDDDFDIVFCRNVLIYFDRETQQQVVSKLLSKLKVGGYLFVGHSESVYHMKLPLQQIRPAIFRKV